MYFKPWIEFFAMVNWSYYYPQLTFSLSSHPDFRLHTITNFGDKQPFLLQGQINFSFILNSVIYSTIPDEVMVSLKLSDSNNQISNQPTNFTSDIQVN